MANVTTIGIDLAKNVFHLHAVDANGDVVFRKRLSRARLAEYLAQVPPSLIGMEACGGAHYWARRLTELGHEVRLVSPQFVKPYVKSNKNDRNDAEAICEATARPNMRFVKPNSIEHQDIQALHRIRSRLVGNRTALVNQIRGLLLEYGISMPRLIGTVRRQLPEILEDANNGLTMSGREYFASLYDELCALDERIDTAQRKADLGLLGRNEIDMNICRSPNAIRFCCTFGSYDLARPVYKRLAPGPSCPSAKPRLAESAIVPEWTP